MFVRYVCVTRVTNSGPLNNVRFDINLIQDIIEEK